MVHFQNGCPRVRETGSSRRSELPGKNEYKRTFITFLSLFKNAFFPEKIFLNTCLAESLKQRERQEEKQTELPKKNFAAFQSLFLRKHEDDSSSYAQPRPLGPRTKILNLDY